MLDRAWIEKLENALRQSLPGGRAHHRMSPSMRLPAEKPSPLRYAGVLLLLYEKGRSVHLLFIRRSAYDGIHSGQVSFPGGIREPGDTSVLSAAIRETAEETGIPAGVIRVVGELTMLHIPISNVNVHPFVGVVEKSMPLFRPDPVEVEYLIELSLSELLDPGCVKREMIVSGGRQIEVPYYEAGNHHIWGATAMILSEFLEVLRHTD